MPFFLLSPCHSHIVFLTRSLIFLSISQRFIQYNMTNARAYMPLHAFRKTDIDSILSIAFPLLNNEQTSRRFDHHHSRRTMLHFLLSIYSTENNERVLNLIKESNPKVDWSRINENYNTLRNIIEPYQEQNRATKLGAYWELKTSPKRPGPKRSSLNILKYRQNGFQPEELKLYWNYDQIRELNKTDRFNPITDSDTHDALLKVPVNTRNNTGGIQLVRSGIEEAVFQVPENKQVIVLDFADERMPGGYFLENARTQEEVIIHIY